jgi:carbonic anhydrase
MPFRKLVEGYKSFHRNYFKSGNDLYKTLAREGQAPETLVIACSDSRTDPAIVLNSDPGDLFVVRNVAAIVPPYRSDDYHHGTSAAIEFAVRVLKVKHIVVMGHSLCGGVRALAEIDEMRGKYEFLPQWVNIGAPALEAVENELKDAGPQIRRRALEQAVVLVSLQNLMTFPWIREAIEAKAIDLHGWYLDITSGGLMHYDPETGNFADIKTPAAKHVAP